MFHKGNREYVYFLKESMIREKMKRVRLREVENEDMPSDLSEGVLLHILSLFDVK